MNLTLGCIPDPSFAAWRTGGRFEISVVGIVFGLQPS